MSGRRVVVGMSGGVDSAVSAWILKRKGFDVMGVYMVNWDQQEEGTSQCSRTKDEADARKVCDRLRIPFVTVNFVKEYWSEVFIKMLDNYRRGRTVVPDIGCNREIKFEKLHDFAIKNLGAEFIATGHYASTSNGEFQDNDLEKSEGIDLLCGLDPLKDQSYFLSTLKQHQLRRALFPLGSLYKKHVRTIAKEQSLIEVADKSESMGICFVGKRKDFKSFMDEYIEPRPGKIVSLEGTVLGTHSGVHHFTIGKRLKLGGGNVGRFVSGIDPVENIIYSCEGSHHPSLYATDFIIETPHWINGNPIESGTLMDFRIQRTHPALACDLKQLEDLSVLVHSRTPLRAVAPGQMCVFYDGRRCVGGGQVEKVTRTLADRKI